MDSLESYYLIIIIFFVAILFCSITCSMCSKFNKQVSSMPGSADSSDNPPDIFASTISPANQYNYPTHILVNGQLCAITADETFNIYDYIDNSHNKRAVNPALVTPAPVVAPPPLLYPVAIESEESQDSTTSIESVSSFGDQPPKYENLSSSQVTKIHVAPQDQSMLRVVDERKN